MKHMILAKFKHEVADREALPLYDESEMPHAWKREYGPLLENMAIFDWEM